MNKENSTGAVILDIDGVINSFSNKQFYLSFAYHSFHELAKLKGRKKILYNLPKLKDMGGPNALFKFVRHICGDDKTFNRYCHNLAMKLDYNLIKNDPSMKSFIRRLSSFSDIIVRSDGLCEIASAAWLRVIENYSSAKIKEELIKNKLSAGGKIVLRGKKITISGIKENNFQIKAEGVDNWLNFAKDNNIDLSKSVLIDDSHDDCNMAKKLGMATVHISKLDSFLQDVPINVYNQSLSDVLGVRMSATLKRLRINYGQKVDIKQFFNRLLTPSLSADINKVNNVRNS